jgi:ADP-heptose:LPS heptosyltransferase
MRRPGRGRTINRILVIKLGALGDMVLAMGPFAAIRGAHADARITLLTTAPFADLMRSSPYFDEVWLDDRPSPWRPAGWLDLGRRLRGARFDFVYDLQTSDRSGWYYRLMAPGRRPGWSGIARGCSHPHDNPARDAMHTIARQDEQLARAGIARVPAADLSWIEGDGSKFDLAGGYVLLIPGGAAHRPRKRWPAERFADLAGTLAERGTIAVMLGGADERDLGEAIARACPTIRDLVGRTTFADIVGLARGASGAVGNDTGPMHLIAAAGCPALVLFSAESDPALTQPVGETISVLQRDDLARLATGTVVDALRLR